MKYYHFADKKRALVSRLMTRAACAKARGCKFEEVVIGRTKGRKPFFKNVHEVAARTTTTNNASHLNGSSSSISNGNATTTTTTRHGGRIGITNAPNFNFNVSHEGKYVALPLLILPLLPLR